MSCLKKGDKHQQWRKHTDIPSIKKREEGADGKQVVKLRKCRHLDGSELVESPVGLAG